MSSVPPRRASRRTLARRDWILLPLIAFASALLVLGLGEGVARVVWTEHDSKACYVDDFHTRPNCSMRFKRDFEAPWTTHTTNECGYRATGPCHAPAPGGRIVVVGSSTSWGYMVDIQDVWSVQAARRIGAVCGAAPDVQGVGAFGDLNDMARSLPGALALKPQLLVMVVTSFDVFKMADGGFDPVHAFAPAADGAGAGKGGLAGAAQRLAASVRSIRVVQHYQYRNPAAYASTYLRSGDKADFMRPPFTPAWRRRLDVVDQAVGYTAARADDAHIPLLVLYIPLQVQADIVGPGLSYPRVDALAFDRAVGEIAARHHAHFVDAGRFFVGVKDAADDFYPVNTHLNARGHGLVGAGFADALLGMHVPGLCQAPVP